MQAFGHTLLTFVVAALPLLAACKDHGGGHGDHNPGHGQGPEVSAGATVMLAPAEGARVKIIEPGIDQIFSGDAIPLKFELVKGKRGQHVHAYIDGELMGMFESTSGTLTGVKPGKHTLELRVVASDHNVELDATDKTTFVVK
jgi:hypothetical protein